MEGLSSGHHRRAHSTDKTREGFQKKTTSMPSVLNLINHRRTGRGEKAPKVIGRRRPPCRGGNLKVHAT